MQKEMNHKKTRKFLNLLLISTSAVAFTFAAFAADKTNDPSCIQLLTGQSTALVVYSEPALPIDLKIKARTSRINDDRPILPREAGKPATDLKVGIMRLFSRDIMTGAIVLTRNEVGSISNDWARGLRIALDKERAESASIRKNAAEEARVSKSLFGDGEVVKSTNVHGRDADGLYSSPMLDKYKRLMLDYIHTHGIDAKFGEMSLKQQEGYFRENLSRRIKDLNAAAMSRLANEASLTIAKIDSDYTKGLSLEPDFDSLRQTLIRMYSEYVEGLGRDYGITDPSLVNTAAYTQLINNYFDNIVYKNADGNWEIQLSMAQSIAYYEPEIGALVMLPNAKAIEKVVNTYGKAAFASVYFHGGGSLRSSIASWTSLMPRILQNGTIPVAIDMPGSLGNRGVSMYSLRTAEEVGTYIGQKIQKLVRRITNAKDLPFEVVGRSSGATQAFAAALANKGKVQEAPIQYILSSFSNPLTGEEQTKNLRDKVARGEIDFIVEESLDAANKLSENLLVVMDRKLQSSPDFFKRFGDDLLYMQGEDDEDGAPQSAESLGVVGELERFRRKYSPLGHIYVMDTPNQALRAAGLLKDVTDKEGKRHITPERLEGTHFLYSGLDNVRENARGPFSPNIPASDLPQMRDQFAEVFAMKYAFMDYQIDLSPVVTPKQRAALEQQRYLLTGSRQKSGYLRWFVNRVLPTQNANLGNMDLDQILLNSHIEAGRKYGIPGRIKRVHQYWIKEAQRVRGLL